MYIMCMVLCMLRLTKLYQIWTGLQTDLFLDIHQ